MMTQQERLDYLIRELCLESEQYKGLKYADYEEEQLLRSLMNVRMPKSVSEQFLDIQDAYLKQKAKEKGIVSLEEIPTIAKEYNSETSYADRISIWQGDITRLKADAIVNAANAQMLGCFVPCHRCIDNAIHSAAGVQLREECHRIMQKQEYEEPTGSTKITAGYNLPARHIIHTVGPIISGTLTKKDCEQLADCYQSCLKLAKENQCRSIAFCCISTGEFHFPNEEAAEIAVQTVSEFLKEDEQMELVIFNVFQDIDLEIYKKILCCS